MRSRVSVSLFPYPSWRGFSHLYLGSGVRDPHLAAGLLKMFFRELGQPLLPKDLYPSFVEAAERKEELSRAQAFSVCLQLLPKVRINAFPELLFALTSFSCGVGELQHARCLAVLFDTRV